LNQFTVAARFCPRLFELRESKAKPLFNFPYRMIYAVASKSSVYLYDTQQKIPFGMVSNIHYTRLTDLAWSHDGRLLFVSSTDGFCSIIQFDEGDLGKEYKGATIKEIIESKTSKNEAKNKKKKKPKKKAEKSPSESNMDVDENVEIAVVLPDLPEEIKETIPVDKIIKSNDVFSPEKQVEKPVTPIQIRKFPRNLDGDTLNDDLVKITPTKDENLKQAEIKTPKNTFNFHSKTPTPIEVRRFPRVLQPQSIQKSENDEWPKPVVDNSPLSSQESIKDEQPTIIKTPQQGKTPRRIELQTISTPKSKKKLL
jgi:chromatin assembly factor 1 subunit B